MVQKHPLPFNQRSYSTMFARKLIILMLVQLLLSSFILINGEAADTNTWQRDGVGQNDKNTDLSRRVGEDIQINMDRNGEMRLHGKNVLGNSEQDLVKGNANSIMRPNEMSASAQKVDGNGDNTSLPMQHQSERDSITQTNEIEQQQLHDSERVLSRKRRYLIFPPGSSVQIGINSLCFIASYIQSLKLDFLIFFLFCSFRCSC